MRRTPRFALTSLRALLATGFLLLMAGCVTAPRISTEFDPQSDFSQYRTWGFYTPISMEDAGYATFVTQRIRSDVQAEMQRRGYRYDANSPDVRVNFQVTVRERVRSSPGFYDPFFNGPRGPYGWGGWYPGSFGYGGQNIDSYQEGTLVIDVVDAARNRLAWSGSATSRVSSSRSMDDRAQKVDLAISEIFKQFPFVAGSSQPVAPQMQ